jgi:hypothetical protein
MTSQHPMSKTKVLKTIPNGEYITVAEAAQKLGIQQSAVRTYLWNQRFTTYKYKTLTLLDSREIDKWKSERR